MPSTPGPWEALESSLLAILKRYQQAAEARHNQHLVYGSRAALRCDEICACILDGSAAIAKAEGAALPELEGD